MSIQESPLASPIRASRFRPTDKEVGAGLLIGRIALGIPFTYHGSAILFGAFGGPGLHNFAEYIHLSLFEAFLVGLAQFAGGIAVLSGVCTRLGAICIAIVMLGAIFMVHLPHGYSVGHGGYEYTLTLLILAIALAVTGAGQFSLLRLLPERDDF